MELYGVIFINEESFNKTIELFVLRKSSYESLLLMNFVFNTESFLLTKLYRVIFINEESLNEII